MRDLADPPGDVAAVRDTGVIDLGADRSPPAPYGETSWPGPHLRRRWRRWRRPALAAAIVLGVLAASAPDPARPVSPLVLVAEQGRVEHVMIVGDVLLVEQRTPSDEPSVFSAHLLPTGDYLWSTTDRLSFHDGWSHRAGPILTRQATRETSVARDLYTGAVVWTARAPVVTPVPAAGVVVQQEMIPLFPVEAEGEIPVRQFSWHTRVTVADRDTGRVRWSERSEDGWRLAFSEVAVVLLSRDGTLEVRELTTGRTRASFALPEAEPDFLDVLGDTVVTVSEEGARTVVRGYPLDAPTPRWETTVELGGSGEMLRGSQFIQWTDGPATMLTDYRHGVTHTAPARRAGFPRLLDDTIVFMAARDHVREVVDRATGELIADATGWRLAEPSAGAPDHLLLFRDARSGGADLARLDLTTGEMTYHGRQQELLSGCHSFDGGLVCHDRNRLQLWRWR
jgi:hypothetical protein